MDDKLNTGAAKTLPTVGRIVHFHSEKGNVHPAIVTTVLPGGNIGIAVLFPTSLSFLLNVVQGEQPGMWSWMPFQKDQQARMAPGTMNDSHPIPDGQKEVPPGNASAGATA